MSLTGVNHVYVRPEELREFEEQIEELSGRAASAKDRFRWSAHQSLWGEPNHFAFVYKTETFEDMEKLGRIPELWERNFKDDAAKRMARTNECIQSIEHIVLVDRAELSYPPDNVDPTAYPYAAVTQVRGRPGHAEACEELIRKLAEAIPKVDDPAHLMTFQNYFGNLDEYWLVRPLDDLGQLDTQLMGQPLLDKAFGPAEGGLFWRAGTEAIAFAKRELVAYRPELSNPA